MRLHLAITILQLILCHRSISIAMEYRYTSPFLIHAMMLMIIAASPGPKGYSFYGCVAYRAGLEIW